MADSSTDFIDPSLPPDLAAAVREFHEWSQKQILEDQQRTTPTEALYHYTDEGALRGILGKRQLWCFSHNQQTDNDEIKYSLTIAQKVISEVGRSGDPFVDSLCAGLNNVIDRHPLAATFDFYFFSLSEHRDHMNQWNEYGDKGKGFAIGFAPTLFQPDRQELAPRANENVYVGRVIYGKERTVTRHRKVVRKLAEITRRVAWANPSLARRHKQEWFDNMVQEFIASQLIWNCLAAKSDRYCDERETRYIILGVNAIFDEFRRSFNGRNYVETPLPLSEPGNIVEILIGPRARPGAEATVRKILEEYEYPEAIRVAHSGVML